MEPLSTFFRISPSLLTYNTTTPRSPSSSSFSSPSFADHQTGLKVYRESPASLNSAHQDNPLFEGFPVLPVGERRASKAARTAGAPDAQTPGESPKLQEQLHHLLSVLQHALELHNADGLPDDVAPQLADELEAVAKKLKEKERETPVERQLRAKVQLALTGAEATIRKLRATPTRCSTGGLRWRCDDAAATSPTAAGPSGCHTSVGGDLSTDKACGGSVRDSVCRQLLQSPSSSLSPLSWNGPTAIAGTPMFVVDDASMASPKELPTEQHTSQDRQLKGSSTCEHVRIPTVIPLMPQTSCSSSEGGAASTSSFQPPLYEWMKAVLASAAKHDDVMLHDIPDGTIGRGALCGREVRSPPDAGASGEGLAAAVRAALSNTRTPPLIYGTPLHRRIQRLLAEQLSPSPVRHVAAQTGVAQCSDNVEQARIGDRGTNYVPGAPPSRLAWDRSEADSDSPSFSNRYTDTSSSCTTPMTVNQDDGRLPFKSCLSPFGPTLRERYARSCSAAPDVGSTEETATSKPAEPGAHQWQAEEHEEAAELIAELGLDLQLDPATAGSISNLEVLAHVERWAREQFIAAKRALQATKQPATEDDGDSGAAGFAGDGDCGAQALVDIGIQTEPEGARLPGQKLPCNFVLSTARDTEAEPVPPTWRTSVKAKAVIGSVHVQVTDQHTAPDLVDRGGKDNNADVCSPSRSDQSKRSPHSYREKGGDGLATNERSKADGDATDFSALSTRSKKCHAASDSQSIAPVRRGLFRVVPSPNAGTGGADDDRWGEGPQQNPSTSTDDLRGPVIPALDEPGASPGSESVCSDGLCTPAVAEGFRKAEHDPPEGSSSYDRTVYPPGLDASSRNLLMPTCRVDPSSPLGAFRAGYSFAGPVAPSRTTSDDNLPPDVLFTPGISSGVSKGSTGRHLSRVFNAPSARGYAAGCEQSAAARSRSSSVRREAGGLPLENLRNGARMEKASAPPSSRGQPYPADAVSPRASRRDEVVPDVLFTPGNAQGGTGAKALCDRRMRLPFRLDAATRSEREETDDGDASAQTLSSISSVSIIASEAAHATHEAADGHRSGLGGGRGPRTRQGGSAKASLSQHLRGFLTSMLPCAHGGKAS